MNLVIFARNVPLLAIVPIEVSSHLRNGRFQKLTFTLTAHMIA